MKIAIDIDSTLHHYWDQFADAAKRRFGVDLPYDEQVTWHISRLRPEQLRACVAETHAEAAVLEAEPYPGAVEAIRRWKDAGHFIHITSHRATDAHDHTARWLDRIGVPYDELYCSYDKVTRCAEIGIDVLIDDSPVNLQRAIDEGMIGATILHPWNRDLVEEEDVVAAEDWPALERELARFLT
ncbi:MAG TPA: hypothetical protein VGW75_06930 [Solirubrobacteraceae bacterium]|jgi:hypothetical protein|nr:hypothetical protein [Solirubrobacteraceae bacterium]